SRRWSTRTSPRYRSPPNRLTRPMAEQQPLISVVVPAFNEAATIEQVIRRVAAAPFRTEILVVDDGSTDSTPAILTRLGDDLPNMRALPQERNRGKGAAVRAGIAASAGDVVVIQDADPEYDPKDLP